MIGKQDTQQTASGILLSLPQTGTNLPVHMLSLPSAAAYQNNCDGCVSNEFIANFLANRCRFYILVIYVPVFDRFIYNIAFHHSNESVFVLLVFIMMKTDEHLVSRGLRRCYSPSISSKSVKSSTWAISASIRL